MEPESGSEETLGDDVDYQGSSQTVFSLGWHTLLDLKKSSFWKENMDTVPAKKKRKYNNSSREANAAYARKESEGAYSRNGLDPARLQKLFELPSCQCSLFACHRNFYLPTTSTLLDSLKGDAPVLPEIACSGANNLCYKQFATSKELPGFLKSFWGMSKQDQDSLATLSTKHMAILLD